MIRGFSLYIFSAILTFMPNLDEILTQLAATLDIEIQEGRGRVELDSKIVETFLRQQPITTVPQATLPQLSTIDMPPKTSAKPRSVYTSLSDIVTDIAKCNCCQLHKTRTNTVPGVGNANNPDIMFVGEAPGADEDAQGLPFVGRAGQLLTKMIIAMGYTREDVFIANILKCRPPDNRRPTPEEMEVCLPYLRNQIALVKPKVMVALGATAISGLLLSDLPIGQMRGKWAAFEGIPLMPTFHPSYLLRMPSAKKDAWADLQLVLKKLGRKPPTPTK